jgi:hypothetical protein
MCTRVVYYARVYCLGLCCAMLSNHNAIGPQAKEDFDVTLALKSTTAEVKSKSIIAELSISNKSAMDVVIHYNLNPNQFLRLEIIDENGKVVLNEPYSKVYSPIGVDVNQSITLAKNKTHSFGSVDGACKESCVRSVG